MVGFVCARAHVWILLAWARPKQVTDSLKQIAHATGITVAMVIHQPRFEIWAALDEVLFLAPGGRTVFLGHLDAVGPYFSAKLGMVPTARDNPGKTRREGCLYARDSPFFCCPATSSFMCFPETTFWYFLNCLNCLILKIKTAWLSK